MNTVSTVTSSNKKVTISPEVLNQINIALSARIEYLSFMIEEPGETPLKSRLAVALVKCMEAQAVLS